MLLFVDIYLRFLCRWVSTDCTQIERESTRVGVIREFWDRIAYRLDDMLERTQDIVRLHDIHLLALKHLIDCICTGEISITLLPGVEVIKNALMPIRGVHSIRFSFSLQPCKP
uniref:Uncharacterized protein n=1 Tax=Glossina austeni TaxID=7395 RepID=A0A1A9UQ22_GLOAU